MINRLGFNNEGADGGRARGSRRAPTRGGIVGVNIGANKDSADRIADYVAADRDASRRSPSYLTVNISSPNTPGLRDLQQAQLLDELLARVIEARDARQPRAGPRRCCSRSRPTSRSSELDDVVGVARRHRVDGMIVGNTTIARRRPARSRRPRTEAGGLSGRPLFALSTRMLAETYRARRGRVPADRRRRHRFRRRRVGQDQGRREPDPALQCRGRGSFADQAALRLVAAAFGRRRCRSDAGRSRRARRAGEDHASTERRHLPPRMPAAMRRHGKTRGPSDLNMGRHGRPGVLSNAQAPVRRAQGA